MFTVASIHGRCQTVFSLRWWIRYKPSRAFLTVQFISQWSEIWIPHHTNNCLSFQFFLKSPAVQWKILNMVVKVEVKSKRNKSSRWNHPSSPSRRGHRLKGILTQGYIQRDLSIASLALFLIPPATCQLYQCMADLQIWMKANWPTINLHKKKVILQFKRRGSCDLGRFENCLPLNYRGS